MTFFAAVADTGVAVGTVVAIGSAPAFTGIFDRLSGGDPPRRPLGGRDRSRLRRRRPADARRRWRQPRSRPGGVALAALAGAGYAAYAVASKRLLDAGTRPSP